MSRKELADYSRKMKTGLLVKPSMSDDDIRNELRKWNDDTTVYEEPLPGETGFVNEGEVSEPTRTVTSADIVAKDTFVEELKAVSEDEPAAPVAQQMSAKDKLIAMRAKQKVA